MVTRQTLMVVSVVLLATLAVVVPAVSATPVASDGDPADQSMISQAALQENETTATDAEDDSGEEAAFGNQMTAFMQSNAAQTEDTVDNGMWESAFERANESEKARLATNRTGKLDERLAELRQRNQTLQEQYRNGSMGHEEYVAEASKLSGQIEALEDGVEGTTRAAERAGLNVSALAELRKNARNMTGPDVAGIARSLTSGDGGPPEEVPGQGPAGDDGDRPDDGPPEDAPGGQGSDAGTNETIAPENQTGGQADNTTRGPGSSGTDDGAGSGQGDDDAGPGDGDSGNDNAGDDGAGSGDRWNDGQGNDGGSEDTSGGGPSLLPTGTLFTR